MILTGEKSAPREAAAPTDAVCDPNAWLLHLCVRLGVSTAQTKFRFQANQMVDQQSAVDGREKRQREFLEGRRITERLLGDLGEGQPVGVNEDRSPAWPAGFVGSISHSNHWTCAVVSRASTLRSVGIDTEPIMSRQSMQMIQHDIANARELQLVRWLGLSTEQTLTLIFSAKEAFYKCRYPLDRQFLEFSDVRVVAATADGLTLRSANVDSPKTPLDVHFLIDRNDVFTAAWLKGGTQ